MILATSQCTGSLALLNKLGFCHALVIAITHHCVGSSEWWPSDRDLALSCTFSTCHMKVGAGHEAKMKEQEYLCNVTV